MERRGPYVLAAVLAAAGCGDNLHTTTTEYPPDAAGPSPAFCDDSNPCTTDSVAGSECRFEPVADGTPCEDGDLCTLGDRCLAGTCAVGARSTGELAVVGSLGNFGGKRVVLGPNRFVVVTSEALFRARIDVVAATPSGFAALSGWEGLLTLIILGDEDIVADAIASTGIVSVAAVDDRVLRVFSASDTAVVPRGTLELSGQIRSFSGHGDRLWACTGSLVAGYGVTLVDLADPDAPVEAGTVSLGATPCASVATNDDGHRIYVNTADGVRYVDATPLDTGGAPTLSGIIAPPSGVTISGTQLLLVTASGVQILNEQDLSVQTTLAIDHPRAAAIVGNRLVIEGARAAAGTSEVYVAWYALGASSPTLIDDAVVNTYLGAPQGGNVFHSATDGATLVTKTRAYDLTHDRLDELRWPALLPTNTIARASTDGLRTYAASGAAAIDTTDIAHPAFGAGGAFAQPRPVLTIAIDNSLPMPAFVSALGRGFEDSTRVPLDPSNPYYASPLRIDRWMLGASSDLAAEDAFSIEYRGTSQLVGAGDFIYVYHRPTASSPDSDLTGYWLAGVGTSTAAPTFELPITAATTTRRGFDIDPQARLAVVSAELSSGSALVPALGFYDLSTSPPTLVDQIATDAVYAQIRVAGDRVVALAGDESIVFFERGAGEVARFAAPNSFETQLLAFDGNVAYFGRLEIVPGLATYQLVAAPFGSDSPTAVEVHGIARSLVAVDGGLAVGFDTELLTIHPQCP